MKNDIELLIIGGSAGSLEVILNALPEIENIPFPILLVLHRKSGSDYALIDLLSTRTEMRVVEASEKDAIKPGTIYIAPPDYHLLIETDRTFSLDYSEKINFSRPCIDVTFEIAAEIFREKLACILLSGASADGAKGLHTVISYSGLAAIQDPKSAEVPYMPQRALDLSKSLKIVPGNKLGSFINSLKFPSSV